MEFSGIKIEDLELETIGSWPLVVRVLVLMSVFFITVFLGYTLDLSDKWVVLGAAEDKKASIKTLFFDTQQQVVNLGIYKQEVKTVEGVLNKLTEQLPQKNEQAELLEDVSQKAIANGLQLVSIKPGRQENHGFYQENPIELTLTGNYNGFGEFVSQIGNMSRIVTLHDFTISKNSTEGKGALMMVVLAKTYWAMSLENRE
jgi:type IV pilus assembly protein PilO